MDVEHNNSIEEMAVEEPKAAPTHKAVAFKTKAGKEVNFNANLVRKTSQEKKSAYNAKIIKQYEAQKRRDAREAKKLSNK